MEKIERKRPKHRLLESFEKGQNYVPYMSGTYSGTTGQTTGGNTGTYQQYTPGQQALQGNLGSLYQNILAGQIPSSFTNPQAAINAYNTNFQQSVAPQLAAQYGAGSPQIGSQNALGLAQLQGNLYNTGVQNYLGALGQGTNYALGMPVGQTGSYGQQALGSQQGQYQSNITPLAFYSSLFQQAAPPFP